LLIIGKTISFTLLAMALSSNCMELLSYKKKHLVNLSTPHGALGTAGRIPELQKIRVSVAIPHGGLRTRIIKKQHILNELSLHPTQWA